jgi:hypothetical protein
MLLTHGLRAAAGARKNLVFINKTVLSLSSNASTSLAINTPTGTQVGDIIIAISGSVNRSGGHTASGFTQWFFTGASTASAGLMKSTVLYNILSSAPAASYTFTISGGYGSTVYLALFTFRPIQGVVSVGNFSRNTTYLTNLSTATCPDVSATDRQFLFRNVVGNLETGTPVFGTLPSDYTALDVTNTNNRAVLLQKTTPVSVTGAQGTLAIPISGGTINPGVASFVLVVT